MIKQFLSLLCAICFFTISYGQHHVCGFHSTPESDFALLNSIEHLEEYMHHRGGTAYVPVKFHLVADEQGNGRITEVRVFRTLKTLNDNYADIGLQFYIQGDFNYVNRDALYNANLTTGGTFIQISLTKSTNALNCYIVEDIIIDRNPDPNSDVLGVYLPGGLGANRDVLFVQKPEIGSFTGTTEHEFGHFFSLPHTFRGWDGARWDPNVHGNPVGDTSPGGIPNEKVNKSNCRTAGDLFCDTPPDYNLGNSNCSPYSGDCMDPDGRVLSPDINNFMGYFFRCSEYNFSDEQKAAILANYNSSDRNYLRSAYVPFTGDMAEPIKYAPVDTETSFNSILFEWEAVEGAKWYQLEVGRNASMTIGVTRYFVENPWLLIEDLAADRTYYWRVQPYGEYTCYEGDLTAARFTTNSTTSTEDPSFLQSFNMFPNPIGGEKQMQIQLESANPLQASLQLFNQAGQIAKEVSMQIQSGINNTLVDLKNLSAGIYILRIQTEEGAIIRKVNVL